MKRFSLIGFVCGVSLVAIPAVALGATRSLSLGLSGSDVTELQQTLIKNGYLEAGKDSGYFGPLTQAAVRKFQCEQGIVCSGGSYGVYGPKTRAALAALVTVPVQPATNNGNISMTPRATGAFEFSGWVPDWRAASGTQDVLPHLSQLKSVLPFGFKVSADGKIVGRNKFDAEPWASLIAEAKRRGVRVVPSVVMGEGPIIHDILSNTQKRIALEDEIAALVKEKGFDGIDIDFEAKQARTINYFSTFLKGLYQRMGNKWVYCTVEARMPLESRYLPGQTIPDDATTYANDYAVMNKYCDRVEIMAYDQGIVDKRLNMARSAPYAPVADPGWVENLVTLAAQTISRNKIIIGVPTYGYEYKVTPQNGSFKYEMLWAFNPRYATQIADKLGITPYRTSAGELGFTYDPARLEAIAPTNGDVTQNQQHAPSSGVEQNLGSQINTTQPFYYVTWSDAQAIADKVALARKLGVRGIAVFSMGGAQSPGMWEVLK